ncbi:MAG: aminoglycoside phosphotransferase family protein [Bacteroidia bacterium]|nr:aminoglycoside phosphotransferase family protein [Bacteroidia bacterium]
MDTNYTNIANKFSLTGTVASVEPLGEGFINDTFIVKTKEENAPNYILQRKNKNIFKNIPAMMENIVKVCDHIKAKVSANGGDPMREAMTVIAAKDGKFYYKDGNEDYWAVCVFIEDSISYQKADTPQLAYQGGMGIGLFQSMMCDFKEPLEDTLPGFHNIRFRFEQWEEALSKDLAGRKNSLSQEIAWIESRKEQMLEFWKLVEDGTIPTRVTHNDTKINNILFTQEGEVLCVIDLDTVLSSTCLNDFGDAIRSYTNTGLEDDSNLDNVSMDLSIFKAYTEGYLSQTSKFLTPAEIKYLAFSAKYITYEQVLRFLMDYINGDTYYKIKYPTHNLVRTHAQYKLLQSMEEQYNQMCEIVNSTISL